MFIEVSCTRGTCCVVPEVAASGVCGNPIVLVFVAGPPIPVPSPSNGNELCDGAVADGVVFSVLGSVVFKEVSAPGTTSFAVPMGPPS